MNKIAEHILEVEDVDVCPLCGTSAIVAVDGVRVGDTFGWRVWFYCYSCEENYYREPVRLGVKGIIFNLYGYSEYNKHSTQKAAEDFMRDISTLIRMDFEGSPLIKEDDSFVFNY